MARMNRTVWLAVAVGVAAALGVGLMLWMNTLGPAAGPAPAASGRPAERPPPQRIIAIGPNVVEILFALGARERVVGRDSWAAYPPQVARIPKVGSLTDADLEGIRSLRADLILHQSGMKRLADFAREYGVARVQVDMDSLETIREGIRRIGEAIGSPAAAEALNAEIALGLARVKQAVEGRPRPTVVVVIGRTPGTLGNLRLAGGSFLGELAEVAGGRNLYAAGGDYVQVSAEDVAAAAPEVILEVRGEAELSDAQRRRIAAAWEVLSAVPAVRDERVYLVHGEHAPKPGPRIVRTARQMARLIHPEVELDQ
jgi:iron complex transport system substrate-binding protein